MALLLYIVLCLLIWFIFSYRTITDMIRVWRTPPDSIGALPMEGLVEVMGKAGDNTTQSPIHQSACVLWQIEFQEQRRSRSGHYWATVHQEISQEPFELRDLTSRIQILPDSKAELILNADLINSGKARELDPQTQAALEKYGIKTKGFLGLDKKLQVIERYISTGDDVYVLGKINYDNGIKTVASGRGTRLIISDQSKKRVVGKLGQRIGGYAFLVLAIGYIFGGLVAGFLAQIIK